MKFDQKMTWLILLVVFAFALIALMVLQTGLLEKPEDNEPYLLERVKINAPTSTSATKEGWWDDMPTPVSLN